MINISIHGKKDNRRNNMERKTFNDIEDFLKNNKVYESDDGGYWFLNEKEHIYLLIVFDYEKIYDTIEYSYEPEKITSDPYFSNPASEDFSYNIDYSMIEQVSWEDEETEEQIKLDLTDEEKDKVLDWVYKYHHKEVIDDLARDLYYDFKERNSDEW